MVNAFAGRAEGRSAGTNGYRETGTETGTVYDDLTMSFDEREVPGEERYQVRK